MLELATATGGHLFWITSRAAGIGALFLSSASVSAGLMQSRWAPRRWAGELRSVHEALSIATLIAIGVHGLALLGDGFLAPSLTDLTIPFVSPYQRIWTTLGIIAAWMLALLGLSYYARARIGVARWRQLHRLTALAWVAAVVHSLAEGTDAGEAWFLAATAIAVLPTMGLLAVRHLTPPQQGATA
jgi:sulfoxide reductase heme-binding subunit YedZ